MRSIRLYGCTRRTFTLFPTRKFSFACDGRDRTITTNFRSSIALSTGKLKVSIPPPTSPTLGCGCVKEFRARTIMTSATVSNIPDPSIVHVKGAELVNVVDYMESIQPAVKAAVLFSDSPPVLWAVEMLCLIKDLPGMPWISTIICGTLIVRTCVGLPVAVIQQKAIGRLENLKPELMKMTDELKRETAIAIRRFNWDEKTTRIQYTKSYKKHWRRMVEENNCHPMRNLALSLIQLPFWICFSSALRNIVYAVPLPRTNEIVSRWIQIHNESPLWINSLVLPDPVILPVIYLGASLLNLEYARSQKLQTVPETKVQKIIPWVLRGVIVAVAVFATSVPSAVSMYWAASSSLAFAQNIFLRSEVARRLFKLPVVPVPSNIQKSQSAWSAGKKVA